MTYSEIFNTINSNATVWGLLFMLGIGIWMLVFSQFDKKVDKKKSKK